MPSEYIMYLSLLFVGALAIAGISATMISLNTTMADRALKTELENVLQKLSEIIHNVKGEGQKEIENGAHSLNVIVMLNLPKKIQNEEYTIGVDSTNTSYYLYATLVHKTNVKVTVSLFITPDELNISGTISSSSTTAKVSLSYKGESLELYLES